MGSKVRNSASPPGWRYRAVALAAGGALLAPAVPAWAGGPVSAANPVAAQAASLIAPTTAKAAYAAAARPTLRQGAKGAAVVSLQQRLAALHYDTGGADGTFGASTFHAVVAFQKVNGLGRDGIVGPRTWAALDHPTMPKPRYQHSGYAMEANLSRQVLYLTRNGAVVRILDASSGKSSTPTPTGNYHVTRRIDGWRQSALGLLWRPNYFTGGYAVHGATSVPNYPASHGCVRVPIPAMNRLWGILKVGYPVHVYR
ncbi:L,D-transpeptidase family protein [Plantactinospora siamensis]|uniref:L,D-transpeptidase family protein n=1 Tax=Plantactinospora siamensis TaxID=555372 RepID=A0ABV6P2I1_9ACTN